VILHFIIDGRICKGNVREWNGRSISFDMLELEILVAFVDLPS